MLKLLKWPHSPSLTSCSFTLNRSTVFQRNCSKRCGAGSAVCVAKVAVNVGRKKENKTDNRASQQHGTPIITCRKSVYNFYKGDESKKEKLVNVSDGWKNRATRNDYFTIHPCTNDVRITDQAGSSATFEDFNINPIVRDNMMNLNIQKPVEIQRLCIPRIIEGCNMVIAAETGCGKTIAYLLPLITKVLQWKQMAERDMNTPLGLIVTPSRELAVQIALELIKISKGTGIRTKIITGGRTKKLLSNPPIGHIDVLVCSFGVVSKLRTFGVYNLKWLKYVVLDEADTLFHETFEEKLKLFMSKLPIGYYQESSELDFPKSAQLILSSATIPARLEYILHGILDTDSLVHVKTEKLHRISVPQKFIRLIPTQKPVELLKYIKPKVLSRQPVIVFSNHNSTSYWLTTYLSDCGINATNLHGDMSLNVRRGKYSEFINGKTMVLSTTNGGSRGLDTVMVNHILNYDFPLDTSDYIHRCGRTGRVGTLGDCKVTNFISRPGEIAVVRVIERAARKLKPIPIFNITKSNKVPELEEEEEENDNDDHDIELVDDLDSPNHIPY